MENITYESILEESKAIDEEEIALDISRLDLRNKVIEHISDLKKEMDELERLLELLPFPKSLITQEYNTELVGLNELFPNI